MTLPSLSRVRVPAGKGLLRARHHAMFKTSMKACAFLVMVGLAGCQEQARREIATTTESVVGQDVEILLRRLGLPVVDRRSADGSRLMIWNRRSIIAAQGSIACDLIAQSGPDRRVRSLQYSGAPSACRSLFPGLAS